MPILKTKNFGPIEYEAEDVIEFPRGLPAFEEEKRFLLIEGPAEKPVVFLQSLQREDLAFICLPVRAVVPDYRLSASPEDLEELGWKGDGEVEPGGELLCLAIVTVREGKPPTANLMAPVVINPGTRRGIQAIQTEAEYSHRHPLALDGEEGRCS